MEKCEWIERVPLKVLVVIPAICAGLNACFLLLARGGHVLSMSDSSMGMISGVMLGIAFLCLLVAVMRKKLEE